MSIYKVHHHKTKPTPNALNVLVPRKQVRLQQRFEAVNATIRRPEIVMKRVPSRRSSHSKRSSAICVKPIPWHVEEMAVELLGSDLEFWRSVMSSVSSVRGRAEPRSSAIFSYKQIQS